MKIDGRLAAARFAQAFLLAAFIIHTAQAQHVPPVMTVAKPETVGFSTERLERLHAAMQQEVESKQISGFVTILARHGAVVEYRGGGLRDMAGGAPMTKDTIFRDYSMTKPVTGVAMMILYEQGKWLPADPISKYIPEFAHLKVCKGWMPTARLFLPTLSTRRRCAS